MGTDVTHSQWYQHLSEYRQLMVVYQRKSAGMESFETDLRQ